MTLAQRVGIILLVTTVLSAIVSVYLEGRGFGVTAILWPAGSIILLLAKNREGD